MLESKDLPHCELSKYLENRLVMSLDHERKARAGKVSAHPAQHPARTALHESGYAVLGMPTWAGATSGSLAHGLYWCMGSRDITFLNTGIVCQALRPCLSPMHHAAQENKHPSQVATAEGLTVRVCNSLMKKCETKQRFYEEFKEEYGYPSEFPYRQRVVLLFQNLDGVDVCLFCMYVQEYGEESAMPNRKCVYLSYLDSVKYFRPEVDAVNPNPIPGQVTQKVALRTYVYHQILIGYLAYVKMLGFEQMYIWACPPMQVWAWVVVWCPCLPKHREKWAQAA